MTFLLDHQFSIYGPKTNFRPKIGGHLDFSACSPFIWSQSPNESYFLFSYDILHQKKTVLWHIWENTLVKPITIKKVF